MKLTQFLLALIGAGAMWFAPFAPIASHAAPENLPITDAVSDGPGIIAGIGPGNLIVAGAMRFAPIASHAALENIISRNVVSDGPGIIAGIGPGNPTIAGPGDVVLSGMA